jgi:type IV pilus assembly protein PilY1
MYAIKDTLGAISTSYGSPRANTCSGTTSANCFVKQTFTSTSCPSGSPISLCTTGQTVITGSSNAVDFSSQNGWYVDYPQSGERSNTDPLLVLGTLLFTTNIPDTTACTAGGYSFLYFLDYTTGGVLKTSSNSIVGTKLGNSLATRPIAVHLPNGSIVVEIVMTLPEVTTTSSSSSTSCIGGDCINASAKTGTPPPPVGVGVPRKASWREIIIDQ